MSRSVQKTETPQLKVAIVHNWLWKMRGAERVLEVFCEMFPNADIFVLFGDVGKRTQISEQIRDRKITFSFLNMIPWIKDLYRYTLPFWPIATETFELSSYDLVISASASTVKGVITRHDALHICYMYTPMRYLWDQRMMYISRKGFITRSFMKISSHFLRIWDNISTSRIDNLVSISDHVSRRIVKYYRREPDIKINPPVDLDRLDVVDPRKIRKENYCIAVSAFEENKGAKEALEFAVSFGEELVLTGDGSEKRKLKRKYRNIENIKFFDWMDDKELFAKIAKAKALLFLGIEDFGLIPLEAAYLGTPVIALNEGGAIETIKNGINGFLIDDTKPETINNAVKRVEETKWDLRKMRKITEQHSKDIFVEKFKLLVENNLGDRSTVLQL